MFHFSSNKHFHTQLKSCVMLKKTFYFTLFITEETVMTLFEYVVT